MVAHARSAPRPNPGLPSAPAQSGNLVALLLAVLVLLAPSFPTAGASALARWRPVAIEIGTVAVVLAALCCFRTTTRERFRGLRGFVGTGPNLPVVLLLGWAQYCYWRSPFWPFGLPTLLRIAAGAAIYFVVVYCLRDRRSLRSLIRVVAAGVLLCVLARLALRLTPHGAFAVVSFGNTQLDGAYFALMLVLLGVAARGERDPGWRVTLQAAALAAGGGLLSTGCRSAWTGVSAAAVILVARAVFQWARARRRSQSGKEPVRLVIARGALSLAAAALLMSGLLAATGGWDRVADRAASLAAAGRETTVQWRVEMFHAAWRLLREQPLTGWGLGAFPLFAGHFVATPRSPGEVLQQGGSLAELAHNEYLQIGAEMGVPGVALYLGILIAFFSFCLRALPRVESRSLRCVLVGSMAATVAQAVDAAGNPAWRFAEVGMFFWLTIGLGVAAARVGTAGSADEASGAGLAASEDSPAAAGLLGGRLSRAGVGVATLSLLAGLSTQVLGAVRQGAVLLAESTADYGPGTEGSQDVRDAVPSSVPPVLFAGPEAGEAAGSGVVPPASLTMSIGPTGQYAYQLVAYGERQASPCCCCSLTEAPSGQKPAGSGCCRRCGEVSFSDDPGPRSRSPERGQWCCGPQLRGRQVEPRPGEPGQRGSEPERDCGCHGRTSVGGRVDWRSLPADQLQVRSWRESLRALPQTSPGVALSARLAPARPDRGRSERPTRDGGHGDCCPPIQSQQSVNPLQCASIAAMVVVASEDRIQPGEMVGLRLLVQTRSSRTWWDVTDHPGVWFEVLDLPEPIALTSPAGASGRVTAVAGGAGTRSGSRRYVFRREGALRATSGVEAAGPPFRVRGHLFCHAAEAVITPHAP
jgi:O-antigen ligase